MPRVRIPSISSPSRNITARPGRPFDVTKPAYPGRATADRTRSARAQKSIPKRKAGFNRAFAEDAVAFVTEDPGGIPCRHHRLMHESTSPFPAGLAAHL